MKTKKNQKQRAKKPPMTPFYFQHTQEMRNLSDDIRAKENMEFPPFCRQVFNAGIEALYGIKIFNGLPIKD